MTDKQFLQLERDAQRTANRDGAPMAIYNLNRVGAAMLVIRSVARMNGDAPYAGPFYPVTDAAALQSAWQRMREGNATHSDALLIESEHERELGANPALADCPDFRAGIARILAA